MKASYTEDELLLLSGIQHFAFCERQWALIHLERAWQENVLTVQGTHLHERVDDPFNNETRGDLRIVRSVPILSWNLGLQGVADVIEFHRVKDSSRHTMRLPGLDGQWLARPVEYKRGKPKPEACDEVQLCAQAMCIEEMMSTTIAYGDLYYGQTRRRQTIELTEDLRSRTRALAAKMHNCRDKGLTPPAKLGKHCKNCSLKEVCQPKLSKQKPVKEYVRSSLFLPDKEGDL